MLYESGLKLYILYKYYKMGSSRKDWFVFVNKLN